MRFIAGCLTGIVFGLVLAGAMVFASSFFSAGTELPLLPAAVPGSPDVTLTMGQNYLNDQARAWMASKGMNFGDVSIVLHAPNKADINSTFELNILGQSLTIRPKASFHFAVNAGHLVLVLDGVNVAGFQVPQNLVDQQFSSLQQYAQDQINGELDSAAAATGLRLSGVEATDNSLILKLSR